MLRRKDQRVAVLIDAANMYHSAKHIHGARLNFKNVLADAVGEGVLVRAIAYVITTKGGEEKPFIEAISSIGIEIKSKELQEFASGAKKGDWDVGLTVDAIRIGLACDAIVIVSGDGDYAPLVEYLKSQGKIVEAMAFRESTSHFLLEVVDGFHDLSADAPRYVMTSGKAHGTSRSRGRRGGRGRGRRGGQSAATA